MTRYLTIAAVVLLVAALGLHAAHTRGYNLAKSEMAAQVAAANAATVQIEKQQRIKADAAAAAWESKRNALQAQLDDLSARNISVRLCKPAASATPVPAAARPAARTDDVAARRVDGVQAGPDIGLAMVRYGAECERYRQQLTELQRWVATR